MADDNGRQKFETCAKSSHHLLPQCAEQRRDLIDDEEDSWKHGHGHSQKFQCQVDTMEEGRRHLAMAMCCETEAHGKVDKKDHSIVSVRGVEAMYSCSAVRP
jgi:hypothetical protein